MEKDFICFIAAVALVIGMIGGFITYSSAHDNATIARMVEDGANPTEARCAIRDTAGNDPVCIAYQLKR